MSSLKKTIVVIIFFAFHLSSNAQEVAAVDSLKKVLEKATTPEQKIERLDELSRTLMNVNQEEADRYGEQLIALAEETRNRKLMIKAYMSNGTRYSYFANQKHYSEKAQQFYEKALSIAQQNKMDEETAGAQLKLASLYLMIPDNEKAFSFVTQASSLVSTLNNDSIAVQSHLVYGKVYQARNENILALRSFLKALRIAEEIKNNSLITQSYASLSKFYASIEDYDKAIDYLTFADKQIDLVKEKNVPYQKVVHMTNIGDLYAAKKNNTMAISYYERSIKMADSLRFSTLKLPGYVGMLNQYLQMKEPQKALTFMNSPAGDNLKKYLIGFGMSAFVEQAYGVIYTELNRFDSAKIYLERAKAGMEKNSNVNGIIGMYMQLAYFYKKAGDKKNSIEYFTKLHETGEATGILEFSKEAAKELDSLYTSIQNYPMAVKYNDTYYKLKDSIEALKRKNELTQVEAADELQREAKRLKEQEENKRRRNNIQYLAIVIGIISVFIVMIILGMFKVSTGLIKVIGFFAFLMFFEFIFLIFKKNIYSLTHGEPWRDLAFMIALAAILVPLHHWLEHKVLHYLTSHNRLTTTGASIKERFFKQTNKEQH